jgi:hypothetical protein
MHSLMDPNATDSPGDRGCRSPRWRTLMLICSCVAAPTLWAHGTVAPCADLADSTKVGGLTVSTDPAEADVYIDGKMMGRTPVQIPGIPAGIRVVRISKPGFCDFTDSVNVLGGALVSRTVNLDSACGLVVHSVPDNASVYVENVFVGRTPLRISNENRGWKSVKVMKVNSVPWEDHVYCSPGGIVAVNAILKSRFGTLTLDVFSNDIDVVIDGKSAGKGSLTDYMIPGGWHDIGARTADTLEKVVETIYIMPGETVRWQARFGEHSLRALFCSMALPGLGQVIDGSPVKGLAIMGGFAAAGAFTLVMNSRYHGEVSQYNDALAVYRGARNEDSALSAGDELSSHYQNVHSAYTARTVGFAVAGAVYVFSMLDAFLNHSRVNTLSQTAIDSDGRTGPVFVTSASGGRMTFRITI